VALCIQVTVNFKTVFQISVRFIDFIKKRGGGGGQDAPLDLYSWATTSI
jgi:hypothetical protein